MHSLIAPPKPGEIISFEYPRRPRSARLRPQLDLVTRELRVVKIDDMACTPWTIAEFRRRRLLPRGRYRMTAFDAARRGFVTVYWDWWEPCKLQFGLWNAVTGECGDRLDDVFEQTCEGLLELSDRCDELLAEPPPVADEWTLAIFAVEDSHSNVAAA